MGTSAFLIAFTLGVLLTSIYYGEAVGSYVELCQALKAFLSFRVHLLAHHCPSHPAPLLAEQLLQKAMAHQYWKHRAGTHAGLEEARKFLKGANLTGDGLPPMDKRNYVSGFHLSEKRRWLLTDVLSREESAQLVQLLEKYAVLDPAGDQLYGLRFRDLESAGASLPDRALIRIARQRITDHVRHFYNNSNIMPEFTHLTMRKPGREMYSHQLHSDNCRYFPHNGSCIEMASACCAWRHYSALLYLSASEGGDFFFVDHPLNVPLSLQNGNFTFVRTAPGRLVFFSSGPENLHGVTQVTSGHRHALAMWFTRDPQHAEKEEEL
jgi:hypothetical protein